MRRNLLAITGAVLGASLALGPPALAQPGGMTDADCETLRQRLAGHAELSGGVRRAVAMRAAGSPSAPAPATTAPGGRPEAIRTRLAELAQQREMLEDQRLAAAVKFDLSRASQIQGQIQALDAEKANLERELATLPASAPSTPAAAPASQPTGRDVARIPCQDVAAALEEAVKIRQQELGARKGQPGALPLVALKGQTGEEIARELGAQFAPGTAATAQVGLLDADGDGRLDGFVDVPTPGVFRLVRQRGDGALSVEAFVMPGSGAARAYGEMARRLDETAMRRTGQTLLDALAIRPAGPIRVVGETSEFDQLHERLLAGNFTEAGRMDGAGARSVEFKNFRGEDIRVLETIGPASNGVSLRRLVVLPRPNEQELWQETTEIVRPVSYWRTEVEILRRLETRTPTGEPIGSDTTGTPAKFVLER